MCEQRVVVLLHGVYSTIGATSLKEVLTNNNNWEQSKDIHMYTHSTYTH